MEIRQVICKPKLFFTGLNLVGEKLHKLINKSLSDNSPDHQIIVLIA